MMHTKGNHSWNKQAIHKLFELPFIELLIQARNVHQVYFPKNEVELCRLLSIKTGACPENCAYCPQSAHYNTGLKKDKLMDEEAVLSLAKIAKQEGATRFCMGAAWREPPAKDFVKILKLIRSVKALGLETCVTLGMLNDEQAKALKDNGLDFYNHNLDTSPAYYKKIISTRTYQERLDTLNSIHKAGLKICCGGIIGMGETLEDRIDLLCQLASLPKAPESVPINRLIPIPGTPLGSAEEIDNFDFIRMLAVTRIVLPTSMLRLSGGRKDMSEEMLALCFLAGVNSIFFGEVLLTTDNNEVAYDFKLLKKLGVQVKTQPVGNAC